MWDWLRGNRKTVHAGLAGVTLILMMLLILFDDFGSAAGQASRRLGAVFLAAIVQYLVHLQYQRESNYSSGSAVPQTEQLVPRHVATGVPERLALC